LTWTIVERRDCGRINREKGPQGGVGSFGGQKKNKTSCMSRKARGKSDVGYCDGVLW